MTISGVKTVWCHVFGCSEVRWGNCIGVGMFVSKCFRYVGLPVSGVVQIFLCVLLRWLTVFVMLEGYIVD